MNTELRDKLLQKAMVLRSTAWRNEHIDEPAIQGWLANFSGQVRGQEVEQLHALYLLTHFTFFALDEFREMLRVVYRDLYEYPVIQRIRGDLRGTTTWGDVAPRLAEHLRETRFIGMGNPSESGSLLLYFFRQENMIPLQLFLHSHEIFRRYGAQDPALKDASVSHYVFVDDFCGSGDQAVDYSRDLVELVKRRKPDASASYFVLFATAHALERVRRETVFNEVEAVFELDETFRCFHADSRYFADPPDGITRETAETVCRHYGSNLVPAHPLGYGNGQMLLGFWHNTPDNTLPVIWSEENGWSPIFKRYPKVAF